MVFLTKNRFLQYSRISLVLKLGGVRPKSGGCYHSNPIRVLPNAPLRERNDTFQNMQHIFSGLENAFAGPGWTWKHKKWKDQKFLHRNYIPKIFSTLRKNKILLDQKSFRKIFKKSWSEKKSPAKSKKCQNAKILKFWNFDILAFFDFAGEIFSDQFFLKIFRKFFDQAKFYFFSELRKFLGYSFDVKFSNLFIFYAFRFIRTRQTRFLAR